MRYGLGTGLFIPSIVPARGDHLTLNLLSLSRDPDITGGLKIFFLPIIAVFLGSFVNTTSNTILPCLICYLKTVSLRLCCKQVLLKQLPFYSTILTLF